MSSESPATASTLETVSGDVTERELLHAAAQDRWGDRYTVRIQEYATGDASMFAFRSRGTDDDGHTIKEILTVDVDADEYAVYRRVVEPERFAGADEDLESGPLEDLVTDLDVDLDVDPDHDGVDVDGANSDRA